MKSYPFSLSRAGALLASALLAACASTGPAPVDDLSGGAARRDSSAATTAPAAGSYRVVRGDTLYSIAFRNGLDYRELADWNRIGAPYTIYVGQEIQLGARRSSAPSAAPSPAAATAVAGSTSIAQTAPIAKTAPAPIATPAPFENVSAAPVTAPSTAVTTTAVTATAAPPTGAVPVSSVPAAAPATAPPAAVVAATPPAVVTPAPVASGDATWRWPAEGPIVGTYLAGDQTRQGIDIAGKVGNPVRAASAGTVVYSGNGLIGYGELIIVKHNPAFLSAYGHNSKRLVKEGDRVNAGQTIAEMGSSSASRDSLHFEIRKNGKPVNPMEYLPRR